MANCFSFGGSGGEGFEGGKVNKLIFEAIKKIESQLDLLLNESFSQIDIFRVFKYIN